MDHIYVFDINNTSNICAFYKLPKDLSFEENKIRTKDDWQWPDNWCHYRSEYELDDINIYTVVLNEFKDVFNVKVSIVKDNSKILKRNEKIMEMIREWRNKELENTDKYIVLPDFPISDEERQSLKEYRDKLRDLPLKINKDNIVNYFTVHQSQSYTINTNEIKKLL